MSEADYQLVEPDELSYFERRDRRQSAVDELKERIENRGYNPARPMRVVKDNGDLLVADGNHRLQALRELGYDEPVPCHVTPDGDPVTIGVEANRDEDVYAPEDLFDTLDTIEHLRDEGLTQAEIGDKLGWGESKVKSHSALLSNIVSPVLNLAREHQKGRETSGVSGETFDFTEYWFRTSGLYDLEAEWQAAGEDEPKHAQRRFMEWFCEDQNCDAGKQKVQSKIEDLLEIKEQLELVDQELSEGVDQSDREELLADVKSNSYAKDSLRDAIENLNVGAKNRMQFGVDALDELSKLDANSIDCVVTDPPYGVDFESHRDTDYSTFDTDKEGMLALLDSTFEQLQRVCKDDAHLYLFFPMRHICDIRRLASNYFDVTETPLIWLKNNHAPTQDTKDGFDSMYAHQYESILYCQMPKGQSRGLNNGDSVSTNVLEHDIIKGDDRWHDSQKPVSLLAELIELSTGAKQVVLDPFAGSGSTCLAAKQTNRFYKGFEKSKEYQDRFKREVRKLDAA